MDSYTVWRASDVQNATRKSFGAPGQEWDGIKKCFLQEMMLEMCLKSLTLRHNEKTIVLRT